ncbi:hypothetical protein [Thermasporomyces composti]|jgi:hypothetical protein|uniref:Uncharacterized protein n=1 Tax=Thermasporomyces composti TaxID=696763 RepID=A0A3D9VAX7_THECX|nr:hypothetical protein [Thermasporomyces composti]REF37863.1 hypothetical protein DFJ64_3324 [Thermasporomyces composti]
MKTTTKVALAVAGGYVLGRRKKARAALVMGSWLVGKKLDPKTLLREAVTKVAESPEVAKLREDVRNELVASGRAAANAAISSTLEKVSDSLHQRTEALTQAVEKTKPEKPEPEKAESEKAEPDKPEKEEPEKAASDKAEAEEEPAEKGEPEARETEGEPEREEPNEGKDEGQPKAEVPEQRTEEEPFRGEKAEQEGASSDESGEPSSQRGQGTPGEQAGAPEGEAQQAAKR